MPTVLKTFKSPHPLYYLHLTSCSSVSISWTTFLNYFGTRRVLSSSDSTHLLNIFGHRNTRVAGRSRLVRLHAAKSVARLHKHRSIASAATNMSNITGMHTTQLVLAPRTKQNSAVPSTGGREYALWPAGSLSGGATPPSYPRSPRIRNHRARSLSWLVVATDRSDRTDYGPNQTA